jgi:ubiquitin-protein ligase
MESVRLRRLQSDYEALRRLARQHPKIEIEGASGNPPDRYRLLLKVKSLRERGGEIETATEHRLEVTMPRGYPRDAPMFRMLTPVFHPNIAPHAVCIGDHWTAGESIDLLIQRIGEILAYQSYNTKSPLNGRAAQWIDENRHQIPIDREEFFIDLAAAPATDVESTTPSATAAAACSNCGAGGELERCKASHQPCADCVLQCRGCDSIICLACGETTCAECSRV